MTTRPALADVVHPWPMGADTPTPPPPETPQTRAARHGWGRRRRWATLLPCTVLGCIGLMVLAQWLAGFHRVNAVWTPTTGDQVMLIASDERPLQPLIGSVLTGITTAGNERIAIDGSTLERSSRWLIHDDERRHRTALHERIENALAQGVVQLNFAGGKDVVLRLAPRGLADLGLLFWLLGGLALALFVTAAAAVLNRPSPSRALYAVIAACQGCNLVFIAIESTLDLSLPAPVSRWNMPLRLAFDLATAATAVHAACIEPRRLRGASLVAGFGWAAAAALSAAVAMRLVAMVWWWGQGLFVVLGGLAIGLMAWSYRQAPHPLARVLGRFGMFSLGTWLLLTAALVGADGSPVIGQQIASVGPVIWYVFFASLLLLIPFLSKSHQVMREFSLLAAISTVATSLDLLFVAVFSLGQFTSLTLTLFLSLTVYTGARQWLMGQLMGRSTITTERMFDRLYRVAREVEAEPHRMPQLLHGLLESLFEPLEARHVESFTAIPRVVEAGAALLVPIPELLDRRASPQQAILMRFAHRGRRLFSEDDARLTGRILEQLARVVAFDQAVEQGRHEERLRIAQDLHDDIGARLLTLMYKAPSPEMEDYVRYTLHDLKTLTRGLAASQHPLSHAEVEWRTDLGQRLDAARIAFGWHFSFDEDVMLTVVQWSALTRIMRELVSNAIAHAGAHRVDIHFRLSQGGVALSVTDDGKGTDPQGWSHGLGLGGIRKRVKQLGGEVSWQKAPLQGICCHVVVPRLFDRPG